MTRLVWLVLVTGVVGTLALMFLPVVVAGLLVLLCVSRLRWTGKTRS